MSTDRPRPKRDPDRHRIPHALGRTRPVIRSSPHQYHPRARRRPEPARSEITSAIAGLLNLSMMAVMEVGQRRAFEAAEASGRRRDDVSVEERLAATSAYIQEMSLGMPEDPDAVDRS